jgi:WD40 repeat protein
MHSRNRIALLSVAALVSATPLAPAAGKPVSFTRDIAPILNAKCLTCHGTDKTKGGYQLHTFTALMKPGASKEPSIVPGKPDQSALHRLLIAKDPDDRMPQKSEPLPATDIKLIERWIREGARFDGPDPGLLLAALIEPKESPKAPATYPQSLPIAALAFNPDGDQLALGGYYEVLLRDPANGSLIRRIAGAPQRVQALAFSPDGSVLAVAGGAPGKFGEVKLFAPASGKLIRALPRWRDMALALAFSPDGKRLAVGAADNTIRVFDAASGRQQLVIEQHADWVMAVAFSHDGKRLASGSRDKSARVFDAQTGAMLEAYLEHTEPVFTLAFSGDDKLIYTAGRDRRIKVWESSTGKTTGEVKGFEADILCLETADGRMFAATGDNRVREYAADNRDLKREFPKVAAEIFSLDYSRAKDWIAAGTRHGTVRVWAAADGKVVAEFAALPMKTAKR